MTVNSLIEALTRFRDEMGCMELIISPPNAHMDTAYLDRGSFEGRLVCFLVAVDSSDLVG